MCDSRENEFVVVKNETGGGLFAPRIASIGAAAIPEGCKSGPASAAQRPWSIRIVGEMPRDTPGWIDTTILCDSRENEFVVTKAGAASIGVAAIPEGCKSGPASAAQRPWSISIVGEMAHDTPGWIDTRILCDSRENEFVATQNEGKIALTVVPGGCKSKQ
jgi:hypothetical protein